MEEAGFTDVRVRELAPDWYRDSAPYALAVSGVKPAPGPSPAARRAGAAEAPVGPAAVRGAVRRRLGGGRAVRADRGRARAASAEARRVTTAAITAPRQPGASCCGASRGRTRSSARRSRSSGLYAIAAAEPGAAPGLGDLLATLVAGLTVNIAIVGVNQITDVEIDRVNKPFLPIAAGDLSLGAAKRDRRRLLRRPAGDGR